MHKYFAVIDDVSGRWNSGSTSQAYTFEAKDDVEAARTVVAYLKGRSGYQLTTLGRITCGLKIDKVKVSDEVRKSVVESISDERRSDMGWVNVYLGESMIDQLQLFDPEVRKKRIAKTKRDSAKANALAARIAAMPVPKRGDNIYIPTELYISRGRCDVQGGLAKVTRVAKGMSGGENVHFIKVKGIPGEHNWEHRLAELQNELKKEFGRKCARPDPDNRPEFNE